MYVQSVRQYGQDGCCRKIASDSAEIRCAGRLFHGLAAETGKACLPTVVRLKDGTISCSEVGDRSLNGDGTSATWVK